MKSAKKAAAFILVLALLCGGTAAFTACGDVVPVSITAECSTAVYTEGEFFDRAGTTVTAEYSDGSFRTVAGWTVTEEPLVTGTEYVTVSYTERGVTVTANVDVTVNAVQHVHDFSSSSWEHDSENHWKECSCGEKSETSAHEWSAKTEIIEEIDCNKAGSQRVTCEVCGYSELQTVAAPGHDWSAYEYNDTQHWQICRRCGAEGEKRSHSPELVVSGLKTDYLDGEAVTADGASAQLYCDECGFSSPVSTEDLVLPQEALTLDDDGSTLTLTYGEYTYEFTVTVSEREVQSVTVKDGIKTEYAIGEQYDGEGVLVLHYDGAPDREIALTEDMLRGFDTSVPGSVSVSAVYSDKIAQYTIYVGRDADSGAFRLGEAGAVYKVQAENDIYVDMSKAELQQGTATEKFENLAKDSTGATYPNGAEGYSTANISVAGNEISIKFYSDYAGKLRLGMRAQSGSDKGLSDQILSDAFSLELNGEVKNISGTLAAGSATQTAWCDMTVWTYLDNIAGVLDVKEGLNTITFGFKGGTTQTMRFPNIDYFTLEISDNEIHTLTVDGGKFTDGQTETRLAFGAAIPEITWDDPDTIVAVEYNGGIYTDISALTMTYEDAAIKAVRPSDCENVILQQGVSENNARYNIGRTDDLGKTSAVSGTDMELKATYTDVYGEGDGMTYTLANVHASAKGVTFKEVSGGGIHWGDEGAAVAVFVSFTNSGDEALTGMAYGTECGIVEIGNVGIGETVTASAILTSDGAVHWTNLFWEGAAPTTFTMTIYTYNV